MHVCGVNTYIHPDNVSSRTMTTTMAMVTMSAMTKVMATRQKQVVNASHLQHDAGLGGPVARPAALEVAAHGIGVYSTMRHWLGFLTSFKSGQSRGAMGQQHLCSQLWETPQLHPHVKSCKHTLCMLLLTSPASKQRCAVASSCQLESQ